MALSAAIISAGAALVAGLLVAGETRLALGALAGHLVAVACGLSWILGAVATFDGPFARFAKATLGLAPLRLVLVVLVVCGIAGFASERADTTALGLTFVGTQVLFQLAQADTFLRLSKATSPSERTAQPVRFGGFRLW